MLSKRVKLFIFKPFKLFSSSFTSSSSNILPSTVLSNLISSKKIERDESQISCCTYLDKLCVELASYKPLDVNILDPLIQPFLATTNKTDSNNETPFKIIDFQSNENKLLKPKYPLGLYIYGQVGSGKSMLMDIFYEICPVDSNSKHRIHFHDFVKDIFETIHAWNSSDGLKVTLDDNDTEKSDDSTETVSRGADLTQMLAKSIASEINLLCFDEIQITDPTNLSILAYLIHYLVEYGVVLVFTSNRHPNDLHKGTGDLNLHTLKPFIEIINNSFNIVQIDSNCDYRKYNNQQQTITTYGSDSAENLNFPYFLHPNDTYNNSILQTLWSQTISNRTPTSDTLTIFGREITLDCVDLESKSLFTTFNFICKSYFGPNDYLLIFKKYKNIFISNIPSLSLFENRYEARRFIWLIDVLYEYKCKLYCTSNRNIENLFKRQFNKNEIDIMHKEMMVDLKNEMKIIDEFDETKLDNVKDLNIFSGEEEIFAFKRCISRIYEMQTEEYLKELHVNKREKLKFFKPEIVPQRHEKLGYSIFEKLRIKELNKGNVSISNNSHFDGLAHRTGFKDTIKGSGIAKSISRHRNNQNSGDSQD